MSHTERLRRGRRLVQAMVNRLEQDYHPSQVILFGSYAYGRPHRDSDLDVLIVKRTPQPFYRRLFEVRRLVSPILKGHPFEPIVLTPRELQRRLAKGDQFIQTILRKGKRVYGARH